MKSKLLAILCVLSLMGWSHAEEAASGKVAAITVGEATTAHYTTLEAALGAAETGQTITLSQDATLASATVISGKTLTIDLAEQTLTFSADITANLFSFTDGARVTFKNGTIDLSGVQTGANANFQVSDSAQMTFEGVNLIGKDYTSPYAVLYARDKCTGNPAIALTNCTVTLENDLSGKGGFLKADNTAAKFLISDCSITLTNPVRGIINGDVTLEDSSLTITGERTPETLDNGINSSNLTVTNSTISISNGSGRGLTLAESNTVFIDAGSSVTLSQMGEGAVMFKKITGGAKLTVEGTLTMDEAIVYENTTPEISLVEVSGLGQIVTPPLVAQIGGTLYTSLEAAVEAVPADGTETTIVLLQSCTGSGIKVAANKNVVFDLNGNTYTVTDPAVGSSGTETNAFQLLRGATVTFRNGALESVATGVQILIQNYCNLTLDGVTLNAQRSTTIAYALSNNCGQVTVTGETKLYASTGKVAFDLYYWPAGNYSEGVSVTFDENFTGLVEGKIEYDHDNTVNDADCAEKAILTVAEGAQGLFNVTFSTSVVGANIQLKGGRYTIDPSTYCSAGYTATETTVESETLWAVQPAVAQIGEKLYASLAEAIAAAQSGDTVTLLQDVTQVDGFVLTKNLTLDLGGKTFTVETGSSTSNRNIKVTGTANLTVMNGTMVAGGECTAVNHGTNGASAGTGCYGTLRFESTGKLVVTDVTLKNSRPWGMNLKLLSGTAELENVTILSTCGGGVEVAGNEKDHTQHATVTMRNCTIKQTYKHDHTSACVAVSYGGELTVESGSYTSDFVAVYVYNSGGIQTIQGGTFTGATYAIKADRAADASAAEVHVSGGTFVGPLAESGAKISLTGGLYTADPSTYCAEGYTATETTVEGETLWAVQPAVARIGEKLYASLAEAIAAAQSDDIVTLLQDVTQEDGFVLTKNLTLDLGGKTFTVETGSSTLNRNIKVTGTASLTVKNGTMVAGGECTAVNHGTNGDSAGTGCYGTLRFESTGELVVTDVTLKNSRPWGMNLKLLSGTAKLENVTILSTCGGGVEVAGNEKDHTQHATVTMRNCTIKQTYKHDHTSACVAVSYGGELTVESGSYTSDFVAVYVYNSGGIQTIQGGTFTGATYAIKADRAANASAAEVHVSGGTFVGPLAESGAKISLTGGLYTADPSTYCAEDYSAYGVGTVWEVRQGRSKFVVVDAQGQATAVGSLEKLLTEEYVGTEVYMSAGLTAEELEAVAAKALVTTGPKGELKDATVEVVEVLGGAFKVTQVADAEGQTTETKLSYHYNFGVAGLEVNKQAKTDELALTVVAKLTEGESLANRTLVGRTLQVVLEKGDGTGVETYSVDNPVFNEHGECRVAVPWKAMTHGTNAIKVKVVK